MFQELHSVSMRLLGGKGTKTPCVSSAEVRVGCISKKAVLFQPSIKLATEMTGENPAVWYACQTETLMNQLFFRLVLRSVFMSSRKMGKVHLGRAFTS